jgi:cell fate regulator YaaT (PSP1 superfamily)
VGGIGKCGFPLCCQSFLTDFTPVSIKMAKEQDLALNPMKISGLCGRLLCCLAFEDKEYATLKKKMPQLDQEVTTPRGKATVVSTNLLKETATVKFDNQTIAELPLNQLTRE